ncbi:NAD(P)/FAD-dependent oxidoreductase [Paenibacillus methanolicus]|uniref:Flavin-dependent dehydrogenase n=1 Tax=Paenibacillus methanolicus TaxID=582686 RepID=A0A5S5CLE9_9BACL|nr:NAD(P)/FAD-dependent oxidoreductase [Paenibacillus methanolicus]TYP79351.1 flavin-dependent dehydrogenase [Paenibacillus methanolicus]
MRTNFDVIIVGARVAGSTLAYELGKAGFDVLLLEKGMLPSDTLSTHNFFSNSVAMLREMGVMDRLLATETPLYKRAYIEFDDAVIDGHYPEVNGENACFCIKRTYLDHALFEAATAQAGVTAIQGFRVTDLLRENGCVTGVTGVRRGGGTESYTARLVVGADGRHSVVRSLAGAKRLQAVPTDYASYVGYFSGYEQEGEPCVEFYKKADRLAIVFPTSDGQHVVGAMFPLTDQAWIDRFTADTEKGFRELVGSGLAGTPIAERLPVAELAGPVRGLIGYDNDWFEGMGPGWALVGDALSFKDPALGQGMHDAMYGARVLTRVLAASTDWPASWDPMAAAYGQQLEAKMMSRFGMACQITKNVPVTPEQQAVNRLIGSHPEATQAFLGIYNYANEPEELGMTIGRLLQPKE